jgi:acyl-CoA thioesterase
MSQAVSAEKLIGYFQKDEFARFIGCEITDAGEGWAKVRMEIRPHHLNGVGILHGGAIFTVADLAGAVAANSHGNVAVGISCTVTYMKPPKGKSIIATAREISRSRRIGHYDIDIVDGDSGEAIATFQGTAYFTDKDITYFDTRT